MILAPSWQKIRSSFLPVWFDPDQILLQRSLHCYVNRLLPLKSTNMLKKMIGLNGFYQRESFRSIDCLLYSTWENLLPSISKKPSKDAFLESRSSELCSSQLLIWSPHFPSAVIIYRHVSVYRWVHCNISMLFIDCVNGTLFSENVLYIITFKSR